MTRSTIAALIVTAGFVAGAPVAEAQTLVTTAFSEAYAKVHRKCVLDPFEQETSAIVDTVVVDSVTALKRLRENHDAPIYDVVLFNGGQEIPASREGLIAPISEATLGNQDEIYGFATNLLWRGRGPAYLVEILGLIHTLTGASDLKEWAKLADPAIASDLVLPDIDSEEGLVVFLMINKAMGGSLENVVPGLDAVSAMVKVGTRFLGTEAEIRAAFADGTAHYTADTPDTAYSLQENMVPVVFERGEEGTPAKYYTANLVSGGANPTLAVRLIDLTLSRPAQLCFVENLRLSPTNSRVEIPTGIAADVPKGPAAVEGYERFDGEAIDRHREEWTKLFREAVANAK